MFSNVVLYYVNYGVTNRDLVGLFQAYVVDLPCIIAVQVGILLLYFLTSFQSLFYHSSGLLVYSLSEFCYHFGVVVPSFR